MLLAIQFNHSINHHSPHNHSPQSTAQLPPLARPRRSAPGWSVLGAHHRVRGDPPWCDGYPTLGEGRTSCISEIGWIGWEVVGKLLVDGFGFWFLLLGLIPWAD